MIKAIIFDLDHTLFDRYATLTEIAKSIREDLPINPNLSDEKISEIMIKADKTCIYYGWEKVNNYITNQTELFAKKIPENAYSDYILGKFMNVAVPFSFAKPMLETLKREGYKLGLITNGKPGLSRLALYCYL